MAPEEEELFAAAKLIYDHADWLVRQVEGTMAMEGLNVPNRDELLKKNILYLVEECHNEK